MTAAAPRTAAPEARAAYLNAAWRAAGIDHRCRHHEDAPCWSFLWLDVDAASLAYDAAVAALYDTPAHRERQLAIWAEREREAVLREIAY